MLSVIGDITTHRTDYFRELVTAETIDRKGKRYDISEQTGIEDVIRHLREEEMLENINNQENDNNNIDDERRVAGVPEISQSINAFDVVALISTVNLSQETILIIKFLLLISATE